MTATSDIRNALVSIVTLIHEASDTSNPRIGRGVTEDSIADARADVDRIKAALDRIDGGTNGVTIDRNLREAVRNRARDEALAAYGQAITDMEAAHGRYLSACAARLDLDADNADESFDKARNAAETSFTGVVKHSRAAYLERCERENARDQAAAVEPLPNTERSAS